MVTDYGALARSMRGVVHFEGFPEGRLTTGQKIDLKISLLGVLPKQDYHIEVLERSDSPRIMRTLEWGAGVKRWQHLMTVDEIPGGSRLTDSIDIGAGLLTLPCVYWARYMYHARHKPRLDMLASGAF
ncbi:hypothetical protein ACMA5I_13675 [Paracoccaceae bacterium GXU_MW_L88]